MIRLARDAVGALVVEATNRVLDVLGWRAPAVARDEARVEVLRAGGQPDGADAALLAGWRAEVRR